MLMVEDNGIFLKKEDKEIDMDIIRVICAIFMPPLGVFLQVGFGKDFWINLVLTFFFFFPGMIHAIWIIGRK